jgi:hypothetical protein
LESHTWNFHINVTNAVRFLKRQRTRLAGSGSIGDTPEHLWDEAAGATDDWFLPGSDEVYYVVEQVVNRLAAYCWL